MHGSGILKFPEAIAGRLADIDGKDVSADHRLLNRPKGLGSK